MREEFDFSGMSEEEKAAYDEVMETYFNSDEFLDEPWVQMMIKEMNRKKTLIIVPRRIKQLARAVELVKEIVSIEDIEADIDYSLDMTSVFPCDASIDMIVDTVEGGKKSKKQVQELLDITDDFVCMARRDGRINVTIGVNGVMAELK